MTAAYLTVRDAAAALGTKPTAIHSFVRRGLLPAWAKNGSTWVILRDDLHAFVAQRAGDARHRIEAAPAETLDPARLVPVTTGYEPAAAR
jgi:excisionase family DNA binding protein